MIGLSRSYSAMSARPRLNQATLYDFTRGSLPDDIIFARDSDGYYLDASGSKALAPAGQARFDHDPSTLAPRGLLMEPAHSNLLLWNQDLDQAAWTKSEFSASGQTTTAPDGSPLSGWTFGDGYVYQDVASISGGTYTVSVWLKANQSCSLGLRNLSISASGNVAISVTTSWQRFEITNTVGSTSRFLLDGRTSNGFGTSDLVVYAWMPQIEAGSDASSEIATSSAAVTRAADVAGLSAHSGTFDVEVTDGDGVITQLAAETLSPGWWPASAPKHVKRIRVFETGTF